MLIQLYDWIYIKDFVTLVLHSKIEGTEMTSHSIIDATPRTNAEASVLQKWIFGWRAWRQRRRDLAELRGLSSSALRDLAIDRSELSSVVNAGEGERRRNRS